MEFTATQIAQLIQGKIVGIETEVVNSFGKIEEATTGQLSFLANLKYEDYLYTTKASIVIINEDMGIKKEVTPTLIIVKDAYGAFATLLRYYETIKQQELVGIEQPSYISDTATIGTNCYVGAFAYLGKNVTVGNNTKIYPQVYLGDSVTVGDNCTLHPGVKVYHDCIIGNNVTIHSGTILGADGFGFAPQADGDYKKVPQIGNVVIQDRVEIGANTTIDRATIGSTIIKSGAKLDNLIQIAHNVEVGNSTVIAAQVGVSGSTKIGNNVVIGGQAGLAGHIVIADGTKINGQSGISKNTKPNSVLTGTPMGDYSKMMRNYALLHQLPELNKRVADLEKK